MIPPGQSFGSGTFFNKEITSKKIPIRYFEFKLYFHQKRLLCCKLLTFKQHCIYVFQLLDDVKEISRGCICFIAE